MRPSAAYVFIAHNDNGTMFAIFQNRRWRRQVAFKRKKSIFMFLVLPGNADTLVW